MQIWTTPKIHELYLERQFPVVLRDESELKDSFLIEASQQDIAILNLDGDYQGFHDAVCERGKEGRIIFIASKNTAPAAVTSLPNALILDRRLESPDIKHILRFVLEPALWCLDAAPLIPCPEKESGSKLEHPLDNPNQIRELLTHIAKHRRPVLLAFEVVEDGERIMARGTCEIKAVQEEMILLHNFRHSLFLKSLKPGVCLKGFFPFKHENKEGLACIETIEGAEVRIAMPEKLFSVRDIRVQPSKREPIGLYLYIPHEPTKNYRVLDISQKGIGFVCSRDLPLNSVCHMTIILPNPNTVVVAQGVIRHKQETATGFHYGVEMELHPWDADSVAKYLMRREVEIIALLRNR